MHSKLSEFRSAWFVDFEFRVQPGERPEPVCLVARELSSRQLIRQWLADGSTKQLPYDVGDNSLFVAFYAPAELSCHLALGWPMPTRVLDLYAEFRCLTNGLTDPRGNGLLGALARCGLNCLAATEKQEMRELASRGGPYNEVERAALLDYCQTDVDALPELLEKTIERIDLPYALLRGRYMRAVASMEHRGVPVDAELLSKLREHWPTIQEQLIVRVDPNAEVYDGRTFKADRWAAYLNRNGVAWTRLPSGSLALDDETFRQMTKRYPKPVGKFRELRHILGQMRLESLAVGADGRNRCMLSPLSSRTGRNQPGNSRYIFGPSNWLRSLIKPTEGNSVAYLDWSQQEFGIAAALSNDANMLVAYRSGDPYLAFAKQAGAVPENATKQSHRRERGLFKACTLGVQYGMGAESLSQSIGECVDVGRELLRLHKQTYPSFWSWSAAAVDYATLFGYLQTVFGWRLHVGADYNPRSLANFPCQANGAEMLRLACSMMDEQGVGLCCPIHDAVLIEGPTDSIGDVVRTAQACMREASAIVLGGFELQTDAEVINFPNRFEDERGAEMWALVTGILAELTPSVTVPTWNQTGQGLAPNGTSRLSNTISRT
ncbi:MAG: DNA polymerase I [Pirellulaceae bacterium]|nr:DNA polymerase I [Pirellulaceae bacterium]